MPQNWRRRICPHARPSRQRRQLELEQEQRDAAAAGGGGLLLGGGAAAAARMRAVAAERGAQRDFRQLLCSTVANVRGLVIR